MDEERMRELSLPLNIKPFRVRTQEAWAAFLAGEGELRALMDQKDRGAVSGRLVERCGELLTPAFIRRVYEVDTQIFTDDSGTLRILFRRGGAG